LPVSVYGCEHEFRGFENRELRRIFGPTRKKAAIGRSRVLNEELRNLYASLNVIRMIKKGG
jgi:hypothetical protein